MKSREQVENDLFMRTIVASGEMSEAIVLAATVLAKVYTTVFEVDEEHKEWESHVRHFCEEGFAGILASLEITTEELRKQGHVTRTEEEWQRVKNAIVCMSQVN